MAKPEIRLKGFEGEWKKHSLKEKEFTIIAGGDIDRSLIKDKGKYPVIANALSNEDVVFYNKFCPLMLAWQDLSPDITVITLFLLQIYEKPFNSVRRGVKN